MTTTSNPFLAPENATSAGVDEAWALGNEQWWNWYMSLADNPEPAGPLVEVPPASVGVLPSYDEVLAFLAEPYDLPVAAIDSFWAESFVKLPGVLTAGVQEVLRRETVRLLDAAGLDTGFRSLEMMWQGSDLLRAFALSPRLGGLSAALLGVDAVRLYHDNALSKEPGCGRTPWHFDDHHFPIAGHDVLTVWAPLQPVPVEMGPLAFARGRDTWRLVEGVDFDKFGTSYDRGVSQAFREVGVAVQDGAFAPGEVSVHSSLCFHTAGPNRTTASRTVLATTYFADGSRVVDAPTMVSGDWRKFIPDAEPGQPITGRLNPVVR